jgi:hypothetical protein
MENNPKFKPNPKITAHPRAWEGLAGLEGLRA